MSTFRRYPDLDQAALAQRKTRLLNMWYFLKHLDGMGCGVVDYTHALCVWVKQSGQTDETFRNIIADGDGPYWGVAFDHGHKAIYLRSPRKVAKHLMIEHTSFPYIDSPLDDLFGGIAQKRARAYAATHCRKDPKPISRAVLRKTRGVCTVTMLRYEQAAGVAVKKNFAIHDGEERTLETIAYLMPDIRKDNPNVTGSKMVNGKCFPIHQRPNTYFGPSIQHRGRQTVFRFDNRAKQASGNKRSGVGISKQRINFDDAKKAAKAAERGQYAYLLLSDIGCGLWERLPIG